MQNSKISNSLIKEKNYLNEIPVIFFILPLKNKLVLSTELSYNYSISNNFQRSINFNTYESNEFKIKKYFLNTKLFFNLFENLPAGYEIEYNNFLKENIYRENNLIYNYEYKREHKILKNNFGIKIKSFSFGIGFVKEEIKDISEYKTNEFYLEFFNISFNKMNYKNFPYVIFDFEFQYNIKKEQSLFQVYNENFLFNLLDFSEKFEFYLFKKLNDNLLYAGFKESYKKFDEYEVNENKWINNYNLEFIILIGSEFYFLKYFSFYLEPQIKLDLTDEKYSENNLNLLLYGGLVINFTKQLKIEIRNKPLIFYSNTDNKKESCYELKLLITIL